MKLIKAAGVFLIVATASQVGFSGVASAGSAPYQGYPVCDGVSSDQCNLSAAQLQALLVSGNYACGAQGRQQWDEFLTGGATGTIFDYKKGPSDPKDPTVAIGTYSIDTNNAANTDTSTSIPPYYDTITYTYPGSGPRPSSFVYVVNAPFGQLAAGLAYTFYEINNGSALSITVGVSHC